MKKGDTFPVQVQGITVANAVVEEVEHDRVTLLIPGTRAVVGVRVSLSDDTPSNDTKEVVIDGVVTPEATPNDSPVDTPAASEDE